MSRTGERDSGDNRHDTRALRRIQYSVPVLEKKNLQGMGILRDITESGVGIRGLRIEVGETKTFVIVPTDFLDIDPLIFDGQCRWTRKGRSGEHRAGFEITDISEPSLQELRRFIRFIEALGEAGVKS